MRRRRDIAAWLRFNSAIVGRIVIVSLFAIVAGCSPAADEDNLPPQSIQTIEYYPFQVKGYQNTYPKRTIAILTPVDARNFQDTGGISHDPFQGHPAVGVILTQTGKIDQREYGPDLASLVQDAITHSAHEAGLNSSALNLPLSQALKSHPADYVMAATITEAWVNKHRGPDDTDGAVWYSTASVTIDAAVYKPPFEVPFWQGESTAQFNDPPLAAMGSINPEDDTAIYDDPGQVLSVALTRAVAGLFKRDDLRTLIGEDTNISHR
ncbi:MAG: hypothetical protein ABSG46_10145 [Candidatus Binataceae bacterium]|jgi:hypothetical protein